MAKVRKLGYEIQPKDWRKVRGSAPATSKVVAISPMAGIGSSSGGYRRILVVKTSDGRLQPFYESSGRHSGEPGCWFPFNGMVVGWISKIGYCEGECLHRFGTRALKVISDTLGRRGIVDGMVALFNPEWDQHDRVNDWLLKEMWKLMEDELR